MLNTVKRILKKIINNISNKIHIKNIILFESIPDYSDNTKKVFDEFINRKINRQYTLVWVCNNKSSVDELKKVFKGINNTDVVFLKSFLYKFYYQKCAKAFISCNQLLEKSKPEQYYCDLAHGCAFKNCVGSYSLPYGCEDADVMTVSNFMAKYDAINLSCNVNCMRNLGYARNDDLLSGNIDVSKIFNGSFSKVIYWLPTYRQHKWSTEVHSNISMPIIHDSKIEENLNEFCRNKNVLIIVKMHNAQNTSLIKQINLTNIVYIDNEFLNKNGFSNYELLGSCDAMISDYSSVYYDYLLCDKPIGLCWEDFNEYSNNEGFTVDPNMIMVGGEKIYNIDDLCCFIERVCKGEDILKKERTEIKNLVHDHIDNCSTRRIVDYLIEKIS